MTGQMTLKADEINTLVHCYLQESGFKHAAFSLRGEAQLDAFDTFKKNVPYGELISLLGKALLYNEAEKHYVGKDEMVTNCTSPFYLMEEHVCNVDPKLKPSATLESAIEKRKAAETNNHKDVVKPVVKPEKPPSTDGTLVQARSVVQELKGGTKMRVELPGAPIREVDFLSAVVGEQYDITRLIECGGSELFCVSWNPREPHLLAAGSKDGTVHLKRLGMSHGPAGATPNNIALKLGADVDGDLTSLDWNATGTLLAIGCYDHKVRVVTSNGQLHMEGAMHRSPVFSARFSKDGHWLVSAGLDHATCVWNITEKKLHKYAKHEGCCLDVEWITNEVFAFCGSDQKIHVMHIDDTDPFATFIGHTSEVNTIQVDPTGSMLASCSDDYTASIWNVSNMSKRSNMTIEITQRVALVGHEEPVNNIGWAGSLGVEIVATSSFDCTARLWNAYTGACLRIFRDHVKPVFTLDISPNKRLLVTGGSDGWLHVYDIRVRDMTRVWSWRHNIPTNRGVFDMSWQADNATGRGIRLALALETGEICLIDTKNVPQLRSLV
ncbi:WD40 repeat-like protein [Peniophora sp. CONT]|nr:WD40 repeat-like protein [Peniophora sp. CONT]